MIKKKETTTTTKKTTVKTLFLKTQNHIKKI